MPDVQWPADQVERRSVASLVPYAKNARTHSPEQIRQLVASIKQWGWTVPVLVDETGGIIAGHGRVMAAKAMNLADVPVMVARGWTDEQRRAYVLADNQIALNAGWDDDLLKGELRDLGSLGFDMTVSGFSAADLATLTAEPVAGRTDPDEAPPAPPVPASLPGDVWLLGKSRIVCGDCTDAVTVTKALNGAKPHLMVTDPPYGVKYDPAWRNRAERADGGKVGARATGVVLNDDRADWREAWALFPGNVAYIWHAGLFADVVADSLRACRFQVRAQIVWVKSRHVLSRGHYHPQHEPCLYSVRVGC
ncbi:ParB N-terminal domain-containing protein [Falsiroseomonas frigidaquae]|uniref:ParB N-terminal domain-containing protein n=1 Tax=Falsiroseomonas frigidaquae TaxID=487318 RepID=UPI001FD85955|nr:ParB N-terminal domain-containing protein [Falsiroseomonas frigidaquae]